MCQKNQLKLLLLSALDVKHAATIVGVGSLQCYSCSTTEQSCASPDANSSLSVISCSTACQLQVIVFNDDNSLFYLSRGCSASSNATIESNCCQNQGTQRTCTAVCNDVDFCNSEPYTNVIYDERCPVPTRDGEIVCNSCTYTAGSNYTACLQDPMSALVDTIYCPINTSDCTIISIVLIETNAVYNYQRGCNPIGSLEYGVTTDSERITWICQCDVNYCNNNTAQGDGTNCLTSTVSPTTNSPSARSGGNDVVSWKWKPITAFLYRSLEALLSTCLIRRLTLTS